MARVRRGSLLAAVAAALLCAPGARAGGDFVDLAARGTRVWLVGETGVRELDARTGRTVAAPRLAGAAYPLSVALAGGAAWVASVENGYVSGALSRIDLRNHKVRVVWRRQDSSVQYVAAGAGSVWALIGSPGGSRIVRFDLDGHLSRTWPIRDAGRIAADQSGCWISTSTRVLHIDQVGNLHRVGRARLGDITTGAGAVWLPQQTTIVRIDEHTGHTRTLHTATLRLGGFQHDLVADAHDLYAVGGRNRNHSTLLRIDPASGHTTGATTIPGIADSLALTPRALWVATIIAPIGKSATGYDLIRIDPHTLQHTLLVHIP